MAWCPLPEWRCALKVSATALSRWPTSHVRLNPVARLKDMAEASNVKAGSTAGSAAPSAEQ